MWGLIQTNWCAPKTYLVSISITKDRFSDAICIGETITWLEAACFNFCDPCFEVVEKDRHHRVTSFACALFDEN